jgi:hypothetical protein
MRQRLMNREMSQQTFLDIPQEDRLGLEVTMLANLSSNAQLIILDPLLVVEHHAIVQFESDCEAFHN